MAAVPPPTGDWLALPAPVHADLSPDGSRLAVTTVRVPRGTEDEITRLAVVSVADGKVSGLPRRGRRRRLGRVVARG